MYQSYLWPQGRMKWVARMTKGRPSGECTFCRIARNDPKVPKKIVYRDDTMMVLMNMFPYNPGHLQVVPTRHVEWPEQLAEEEYQHFYSLIKKTIKLLRKALNPMGFNAGMNIGKSSGQSITHLHFQIVPRYSSEVGFIDIIGETKVMPETLDQTYKRIMRHADTLKK